KPALPIIQSQSFNPKCRLKLSENYHKRLTSCHGFLGKQALALSFILLFAGVATASLDCGETVQLKADSDDSEFETLPHNIPSEGSCKWEILGGENCEVELSCTINLPESDDCSDASLLVSDGAGGQQRFCGQSEIPNLRASEGLRDLFLLLQGSDDFTGEGDISCSAKCAAPATDGVERLHQNFERKTVGCVCGLRNDDDRIVGGEDAKFNEFPWQAAIVKPGTRIPFCGGTLINSRYILTATHCFWFAKKKASDMEVLLHAHLLDMHRLKGAKDVELGEKGSTRGPGWDEAKKSDDDENTLRFEVEEVIMHPLFTKLYDYDFALLRLKGKVDIADSDSPTPICLPPVNTLDSFNLDGKQLTVSGWGLADENAKGSTRLLQKLDVPYISSSQCSSFYKNLITERMMCSGFEDGEQDACTGDSGGPLIHQVESKQWWQMGVVSFGEGCARAGKPGVYAKVTEMNQWISFNTAQDDIMGIFQDKVVVVVLIGVFSTLTTVNGQCGKAFLIEDSKSASFKHGVNADLSCKWELLGTRTCEIEVTCKVDLPKDQDCGDNYLLITDGFAGAKKSCGSETFSLKASTGLRDLFLVLMTSDDVDTSFKGIECTAKCSKAGSTTTHLAKDWSRKVDNRCVCGLRNEDDRIVGGVDARFNEFPWLAAIVNKGTRQPFCGGALINDRFILTAVRTF
ncbi:Coagulation factor X, partial [Orchesella cincta]